MGKHFNSKGLSIRAKLILGLGAIGMTMLLTSVISFLEYRRMSDYVTELIDADIECINVSQKIAANTERYNLKILSTVGAADTLSVTDFDLKAAVAECENIFLEMADVQIMPMNDSLLSVFVAYTEKSRELEQVIASDFVDSRSWYFDSLQPLYNDFTAVMEKYNEDVHLDLMSKAEDFQAGFYRSIIPTVVSVGAGLLLLFLLLVFILAYYVKPIYKMLDALDGYENYKRKYTYTFDGDDQLQKLNSFVSDLADENMELKRRNKALREEKEQTE